MATVNFTGFETGDKAELNLTGGTIVTSPVRTGTYALRINPITSATQNASITPLGTSGLQSASNGPVTTSYIQFYFRIATAPASGEEIVFALTPSSGGKVKVTLTNGRVLKMYNAIGVLLATGTTVLATGTWYQLRVKCGSSATVGAYELQINGVSEFSGTGNTNATGAGACILGKNANTSSQTIDVYYDDCIWDDAAYPTSTDIKVMLPNADGNYQQWTIGAGSGNHYQNVNTAPPSGTTYLLSGIMSANTFESEALTDGGTAGITGTVTSIKSVSILKKNSLTAATVRVLLRSNTTDDITATNYSSTASFAAISKVYDTDPATSAAWALPALDALETGAKSTDTNGAQMDFTAAMVAFAPSNAYTLTLTAGVYSLTGTAAGLAAGRKLNLTAGSYSITGTAASLLSQRKLNLTAGVYSITGTSTQLLSTRKLNLASGSYTLTGVAAQLKPARSLSLTSGIYSLTGSSAALVATRGLNLAAGVYSITGTSASLIATRSLNLTAGVYSITGVSAQLLSHRSLNLSAGSYTITGDPAALVVTSPPPPPTPASGGGTGGFGFYDSTTKSKVSVTVKVRRLEIGWSEPVKLPEDEPTNRPLTYPKTRYKRILPRRVLRRASEGVDLPVLPTQEEVVAPDPQLVQSLRSIIYQRRRAAAEAREMNELMEVLDVYDMIE